MSDEHEVLISGLFVNIWIKLKHDLIKAILQLAHGLFFIGQLKKKMLKIKSDRWMILSFSS